jgi:GH18 family chitinase
MIGFLPGYSTNKKRGYQIESVPGDQLAYLVYCFAGFAADGDVWQATTPEPKDETKNFPKLQALKATYPNLRLMVSVGGWNNSQETTPAGEKVIAAIASSAEARQAYVKSCLDTIIRRSPPPFRRDRPRLGVPGHRGHRQLRRTGARVQDPAQR